MKNMNHRWGSIQRLASDKTAVEELRCWPAGVTGSDDDEVEEGKQTQMANKTGANQRL